MAGDVPACDDVAPHSYHTHTGRGRPPPKFQGQTGLFSSSSYWWLATVERRSCNKVNMLFSERVNICVRVRSYSIVQLV
jgi:hypothetical protein